MQDYRFGNFLCALREEAGLTQTALGARLGVTAAAVSKWENGEAKPRVDTLNRLAEIFSISVEELLAGRRIDRDAERAAYQQAVAEKYAYVRLFEAYNNARVKLRRGTVYGIDVLLLSALAAALTFFVLQMPLASPVLLMPSGFPIGMTLWMFFLFPFRDLACGGCSFGKRLLGLCILDARTWTRPTWWQLIARNLLVPLMGVECIVALGCGKRLGDMLAKTLVLQRKTPLPEKTQQTAKKNHRARIFLICLLACGAVAFYFFLRVRLTGELQSSEAYQAAAAFLTSDQDFCRQHGADAALHMKSGVIEDGTAWFVILVDEDTYLVDLQRQDGEWVVTSTMRQSGSSHQ